MLFVMYCLDKPFSAALRAVTRDDHLAFIGAAGDKIRLAGPLLSDDGEKMIGSLLIVDFESLDAVRAWTAQDPYNKVGLFASADIRPWKGRGVDAVPAPDPVAEEASSDAQDGE